MTDVRHLPGPASDFWDWQLHASCRGRDTEQFFHPENERGPAGWRARRPRRRFARNVR